MKILVSITLLVSLTAATAFAQDSTKSPENPIYSIYKKRKFVLLPSIYYTPETNWSFGAVAIGFFRFNKTDTISPISNVRVQFAYTLNEQIIFRIPFSFYLKENKYQILGNLSYYDYPYFFAGIGNSFPINYSEKYTNAFPRFELLAMQRVWKKLYTGPKFFFQNSTIKDVEADGLMQTGLVPGYSGGVTNALGWELRYDQRDNVYSTYTGFLIRANALFFDGAFGSDFEFNQFDVDLRKFFKVGKKHAHIIALQSRSQFNFGDTPFNRMAQIGGNEIMRGYKKGQYRDQFMTAAQIEYRTPFWKMVGLTAFLGTGAVASDFQGFDIDNLRPSYGAGMRIIFNEKERIHLRIDYARGDHYDEYYITLSEAF